MPGSIQNKNKIFYFLGTTLIVLAIPVTIILLKNNQDNRSHAAAADKLETEGGVLNGNATIQSDSSASGGNYVLFENQISSQTGTYGAGIGSDTKANIQIRNASYGKVSHRFKASTSSQVQSVAFVQRGGLVYSGGNGGKIEISIQTDDGTPSHNPSGIVLGSTSFSPGNVSGNWEKYTSFPLSPAPTLSSGSLYHVVFRNIDPAQDSNWISINEIYVFNSTTPRQPHFSDLDYAVLGFRNGAWSVQNDYTAPMDITYANGVHDGQAYFGMVTGSYGLINGGNQMVREHFTVSGGNKTVNKAFVRVGKQFGTGNLVVTLETNTGSLIDQGAILASSIGNTNPGADETGGNWVGVTFRSTHVLTNGQTYNLRLSTSSDTQYSMVPIRSADDASGPSGSGEPRWSSYSFTDGSGQKTTDGTTWLNLYQYSQVNTQFYFTITSNQTTSTPTPTSSTTTYNAIFTGDATGATDVTTQLRDFLESHNGQRVALVPNGVYKISQMSVTINNLTLDFRGARINGSLEGAHGIFRMNDSTNVTLNDPKVYGTGTTYQWIDADQYEHGISVNGGTNITINNPYTRQTRGDGVYVTYSPGFASPVVVINNPDIAYSSRNGISPVAGTVTVHGGKIIHTGLHGIDFESNDTAGSQSIIGVVDGVDIRGYGELPVETGNYAIAAGGDSTGKKESMLIQNCTGDSLRMTIRNTLDARVKNNTSDTATQADLPGSTVNEFTNNIRITKI